MKLENLKEVNNLANNLKNIDGVLEADGNHLVRATRYVSNQHQSSYDLNWELVEPLLIKQRDGIKAQLKKLGVEV